MSPQHNSHTAALSYGKCSSGYFTSGFSERDNGSRFSAYNAKTTGKMKAISLTPTENVATGRLARVLATKALELLTSMRLNCVLGCLAVIAVLLYQATGEHPVMMATLTLGWATHFAALSTIDIRKKGGEL